MTRSRRLAVIGGDGIGPEVVAEGLRVLEAVAEVSGFSYELARYPFGAEHYLRTGELMPASVIDEIRAMDAVYFGAVGDPRVAPGVLVHGVLMAVSRALDLFVNVRPVRLYAPHMCALRDKDDIDLLMVRETTEDSSSAAARFVHKGSPHEVAVGEMVYTRRGTERAYRFGFELAGRADRRGRLAVVHQANGVGAHDLLVRTLHEIVRDYPDIAVEELAPDGAAMRLLTEPEAFDVLIMTNSVGGILTDVGAALVGGIGAAAGGRLHPGRVSLFEPTHGSAPKYAGAQKASPVAAILALAMLLDWVGEADAARRVEEAVTQLLRSRRIPSVSARSGLTTREVGTLVVEQIRGL